jgi:hypothetical protein
MTGGSLVLSDRIGASARMRLRGSEAGLVQDE